MELSVIVSGSQRIASESNRWYQLKCRIFLLSRFLEGALYKYPEWMYAALHDKNTEKEIFISCCLLDWLLECLCPSLTNDRRCQLLRKALKYFFVHQFCAPLALRPGTTVPLPPPYATGPKSRETKWRILFNWKLDCPPCPSGRTWKSRSRT